MALCTVHRNMCVCLCVWCEITDVIYAVVFYGFRLCFREVLYLFIAAKNTTSAHTHTQYSKLNMIPFVIVGMQSKHYCSLTVMVETARWFH